MTRMQNVYAIGIVAVIDQLTAPLANRALDGRSAYARVYAEARRMAGHLEAT